MDQEVKIQQYVLLAKGTRGRGLTEIIAKATADAGVFGFGELMDVPSIKEAMWVRFQDHMTINESTIGKLQGSDLAPHFALLQLFAYGTWSDYQANATSFPALTEQQVLKLKQLTVVSLAASQKVLPYSQLQASLQIGSVRELEDFLINHCFYTGIIMAGKLDQKQGCLQVHDVVGRDVRPEQLPELVQRMAKWIAAGDELLRAIELRVAYATATNDAARQHREELEARVEEVKRAIKAEARSAEGMGGLEDATLLDLMDEDRIGGMGGVGLGLGGLEGPGPSGSGMRGERASGRPKSRRR